MMKRYKIYYKPRDFASTDMCNYFKNVHFVAQIYHYIFCLFTGEAVQCKSLDTRMASSKKASPL